jgi:hypothetical protein
MALKSDRNEIQTDISFFCDTALDRGVLVAHGATAASGAGGMDVGANVAAVSAASDAVPLGILLNDVVDKDLTRTHLNQHKDEVQKGGKVTILRKGYVSTDKVTNIADITKGEAAYLCEDVAGNVASSGTTKVGAFMTSYVASDTFIKVEVNLPNN